MPQQLDRLSAEHSIGGNDAPQRLAGAVVVDLPIGRNQWILGNMNRALDAVIGGWSVATLTHRTVGATYGDRPEQPASGQRQPTS